MRDQNSMRMWMVLIFIVFVAGSLAWPFLTADTTHRHANELADQWIREIFTPAEVATAQVNCQATDSDDNGYVSCTLNIVRNGESQLIPIECRAYLVTNLGDSCRPLVPLTMGVRR